MLLPNLTNCVEAKLCRELQNLAMDHAPNSDTLQRNYLNRNVTFDVYALAFGRELQQDVVREAAGFGFSRSDRRQFGPSREQAAALKEHPEYKQLASDLGTPGSPQYARRRKELKAKLERLRYAATKKN